MGRVDPDGRRPDHGPRRRRRPAGPARAGPDPGGRDGRARRRWRVVERCRAARRRAGRRRACASSSTSASRPRFGRRATDWELKGVPVRIELGPRDLAEGVVTLVRRDTGDKEPVALDGVVGHGRGRCWRSSQDELLAEATERRDDRTVDVATIDEAAEAAATGCARIPWADARRRRRGRAGRGGHHRALPGDARRLAARSDDDAGRPRRGRPRVLTPSSLAPSWDAASAGSRQRSSIRPDPGRSAMIRVSQRSFASAKAWARPTPSSMVQWPAGGRRSRGHATSATRGGRADERVRASRRTSSSPSSPPSRRRSSYDIEHGRPGAAGRRSTAPAASTSTAIAEVTRAISAGPRRADPIPGRYTLEVSSPGLERTLRTPAHFARAVGRAGHGQDRARLRRRPPRRRHPASPPTQRRRRSALDEPGATDRPSPTTTSTRPAPSSSGARRSPDRLQAAGPGRTSPSRERQDRRSPARKPRSTHRPDDPPSGRSRAPS